MFQSHLSRFNNRTRTGPNWQALADETFWTMMHSVIITVYSLVHNPPDCVLLAIPTASPRSANVLMVSFLRATRHRPSPKARTTQREKFASLEVMKNAILFLSRRGDSWYWLSWQGFIHRLGMVRAALCIHEWIWIIVTLHRKWPWYKCQKKQNDPWKICHCSPTDSCFGLLRSTEQLGSVSA